MDTKTEAKKPTLTKITLQVEVLESQIAPCGHGIPLKKAMGTIAAVADV